MKYTKPAMIAAAVTTLGLATAVGAASVSAHSDGYSLADRIASRFNLNSDEVGQVIGEHRGEHRAERHAERQEHMSEQLQAKVDSGDITAEQKTAIEAKMAELHEDRDTDREERHEEMEAWAEENGIELSEIMPMHGGGGRGFHRMM